MATISSYTFDNMSRIGLDECCKSQTDLQNVNSANYMLQNYYVSDCSMKNTINLATTQPGIMYNGGFNSNFCGTNIDTNSKLTDKQISAKVHANDTERGTQYKWPSWKEIVKRGAAANFNNDENYFNKRKAEAAEYEIHYWKKKNIEWPMMYIKDAKKAKERLEKKLNALV